MATQQSPTVAVLLHELAVRGIHYLHGQAEQSNTPRLSAPELLQALAICDAPRVQAATVSLLLLHPELASDFAEVISGSDGETRETLTTLALAALYLQRMWYPAMTLAMGRPSALSEAPFRPLWRGRRLPAPATEYGRAGLYALGEFERRRHASHVHYEDDWVNQAYHLIQQETRRHTYALPAVTLAPGPMPRTQEPREHREGIVSFRPEVTHADIERFLVELGKLARTTGRVYIAGGASLIHAALRDDSTSTADIDLKLVVADEHEVQMAIRQLINLLQVNVELASPEDFMPLPPDWEARSPWVGRYGTLDVFYFDYYSTALAKIQRSSARDLADVRMLASHGKIERDELERLYAAIAPQLGQGRFFNVDTALFTQRFVATVASVWGATP